jgi:hypothetical protein
MGIKWTKWTMDKMDIFHGKTFYTQCSHRGDGGIHSTFPGEGRFDVSVVVTTEYFLPTKEYFVVEDFFSIFFMRGSG